MPKIFRLDCSDPEHEEYAFDCPGCGGLHSVAVKWGPKTLADRNERLKNVTSRPAPTWTFNGSLDAPTFNPSLLVREYLLEGPLHAVCHSFVRDGKIQFLSDCTHALAGKTVELPEVK